MTQLPRTTPAGRRELSRLAAAEQAGQPVYVYRQPGKFGSAIARATFDRLRADALIRLGDYRPLHGRPVLVTDLGRDVLATHAITKD